MSSTEALILVIEDEVQIRRYLRATLSTQDYRVIEATTAKEGLAEAASQNPDIVLLDLGLPDMDGLEVIRRLREWSPVPIIIISARGQEADKVAALDAGADDYLAKPFGPNELNARLRVALRHAAKSDKEDANAVFAFGDVKVDLPKRQVFVGGNEIKLTPVEYKLLSVLLRFAGKVLTHRQLIKEIWGPTYSEEGPNLRVAVYQLRHKIEADPAHPRYLTTEAGIGYRFRI